MSSSTKVTKVRSTVTLDASTGAVIRRSDGGGRISSMDELDVKRDVLFTPLTKNDTIPNTEVYLSLAKLVHPKTNSLRICLRNAQIMTASHVSSGLNAFTVIAGSNVQNLMEDLDNRFVASEAFGSTRNRNGSDMRHLYTHPSVVVGRGGGSRGFHARYVVDGTLPVEFQQCVRTGELADVHLKLKGGLIMDRFVSLLWVVEQVVILDMEDSEDDEAGGADDADEADAAAAAAAAAAAEEEEAIATDEANRKERRERLRLRLASMIDDAVDETDISRLETAILDGQQ